MPVKGETHSGRAYRPSMAEQETVIRWDREDSEVWVSSSNPAVWRKMGRLGIPERKRSNWPDGSVACVWYRVPVSRFRWGLKRVMGAAEKSRLAVRNPLRRADSARPTLGLVS